MKKFCLAFIAAILLAATAVSSYASAKLYHYGFILSCGETVYFDSPRELSSEGLAYFAEEFDKIYCDGKSPAYVCYGTVDNNDSVR